MAIVGGFLGGGVEMVPEGMGQLCMQWLTPDRLNIEGAVFKGQGPNGETFTVEGGADGRVDKLAPTGRWTISVEHEGSYDNDGPQIVDVESAQSYLVYFGAATVVGSILIQDYIPGATISITKTATEVVVFTGPVVPQEISVGLGNFTVDIVSMGQTVTLELTVAGQVPLDLSGYFVKVSLPASFPDVCDMTATFQASGHDAVSIIGLSEFSVLKGLGAITIRGQCSDSWDVDNPITFQDTITVAEADVSIAKMYSTPLVIEADATKTLPRLGTYCAILCSGGGGGGGGAGANYSSSAGWVKYLASGGGYGGRGGRIDSIITTVQTLEYSVVIGGGGSGGSGGAAKSSYENASSGSTGSQGGSTSISGAMELSVAGARGGSGGSVSSVPSQVTDTAVPGVGGAGGSGADATFMKLRETSVGYGSGGSGGSTTAGEVGTKGRTPTMPSDLSRYNGSGAGGEGGGAGTIPANETAYGGGGGSGGTGLVVNGTKYGIGGLGGSGGSVRWREYVRAGGDGYEGTSGVAVLEMVIQ